MIQELKNRARQNHEDAQNRYLQIIMVTNLEILYNDKASAASHPILSSTEPVPLNKL